jgi:hypothetical protein
MDENSAEPDAGEDSFFEVRIDNISITNLGFILFLKGEEDPARILPIFIGANEAQSIALALNRQLPPRPMTHDLMKSMLESLDCALTKVEITSIEDSRFPEWHHRDKRRPKATRCWCVGRTSDPDANRIRRTRG